MHKKSTFRVWVKCAIALLVGAFVALAIPTALILCRVGWHARHSWVTGEQGTDENVGSDILIVGVTDSTIPKLAAFARKAGLPEVTSDARTLRPEHKLLIDRMKEFRPAVITLDYFLESEQPGDEALADSILAARRAGVPVVLAARCDDEGFPKLSPTLKNRLGPNLRWGEFRARDQTKRAGELVLAILHPDGQVVPSLALSTFAALRERHARPSVEWSGRHEPLHLRYERLPGNSAREQDLIEPSQVFETGFGGNPTAIHKVQLADPGAWRKRTIPYEELLLADDQKLDSLVRGKAVVLADLRASHPGFRADRHPVRYGQRVVNEVPGVYLLVEQITGLMQGRHIELIKSPSTIMMLFMFFLATLGWLAPVMTTGGQAGQQFPSRRLLLIAGLCFVTTFACVFSVACSREYTLVHLGIFGCSLLAPAAAALFSEWVWYRYCEIATEASELWRRIASDRPAHARPYFRLWFRLLTLGPFLLPRRTRREVFEPDYIEIVNDYVQFIRNYHSQLARAFLYCWFTCRVVLMCLRCVIALAIDEVSQGVWELVQRLLEKWRRDK